MGSTHHGSEIAAAEIAASTLRSTVEIRRRADDLLERARDGHSRWFTVDEGALDRAADAVERATHSRYGRGHVPIHSRWRHFEAGGVDRRAELERLLGDVPSGIKAHTLVDLTIVSVLLDGGAGPDWKYTESSTGEVYTRSEGLAVASFHAFTGGMFSGDSVRPLQADSTGLRAMVTDHLARAFQVTPSNPLVGLEERAILLRRFGEVMEERPEVFGSRARPCGIFDMIVSPFGHGVPHTADVAAHDILSQILISMAPIWPAGNSIAGVPLGDCWRHEAVRGEGLSDGWMPFHKLSQWMTYSLLEPFEWSGVKVRDVEMLTALPEYRNGGLLLDSGVLALRDEAAAQQTWGIGDEIVVEWRALTIALMDRLAERMKLPLARMLEGGTWAAGRELANEKRNGLPPLKVRTDGTVF
jgi:hypothetical protein